MGIDALAPSITLVNPETGKGRVTYLCEGQPAQLFVPTPGLWFSTQPPEVMVKLLAEYEREPYPSEQELARIAKDLAAPGPTQVRTFFENMRLKSMSGSQ